MSTARDGRQGRARPVATTSDDAPSASAAQGVAQHPESVVEVRVPIVWSHRAERVERVDVGPAGSEAELQSWTGEGLEDRPVLGESEWVLEWQHGDRGAELDVGRPLGNGGEQDRR